MSCKFGTRGKITLGFRKCDYFLNLTPWRRGLTKISADEVKELLYKLTSKLPSSNFHHFWFIFYYLLLIRTFKFSCQLIFSPIRSLDRWNAILAFWVIFIIYEKIKFLRSNAWSKIKNYPSKHILMSQLPCSNFNHFGQFVIFKKSKWQNLKKKLFFMLELESEGWNLPPCKFLARSEVRINEMPFWRFGWFSWYLEKIIKFLRSNSWSTVKITTRNEFWSTNYPVLILTIFENLSFSKDQNDKIWKNVIFHKLFGIRVSKSTCVQIFSPIRGQDRWNDILAFRVIFRIFSKNNSISKVEFVIYGKNYP